MSKINDFLKKIHSFQWIYIGLWALWAILLITLVLLSTLYKAPADVDGKAFHSNVVASVALLFLIVFFSAIVSTVVVQLYLSKKGLRRSMAKSGGKK
ncbi:hypothetical protein MCANUFG4_01466 [Mycoplasmopsis canis UFG4]|uniref:Uncharacterized protein n=1 Tax=Mycoplasmopsis canis UFG4 TaxID=1131455 RepID=I1A5E4_9BACT|nr:hypothetical protein [Mycoplasmopsis canis]EIE41715.1 hypothetical protein MCANUFG4_01466 [Mycoplasmopsis canis UFG4]